jgi:hypothetical protein
MKPEFPQQILEIFSNTKFNENPFSASQIVPWVQTDRDYVASSRFTQFYERTQNFIHEKKNNSRFI